MSNLIYSKIAKKARINKVIYSFLKCFSKKITLEKDIEKCKLELNDFSKKPRGTSVCKNNMYNPSYDLQIIIPVYNSENYISKCLESIDKQKTKYSFVCNVIDDGSTDDSLNIVNRYKNNQKFKIIAKENGGAASARNLGLKDIYGKYILFVDADDYLPDNAIEDLLDCAFKNKADIVEGSIQHFGTKSMNDILDDKQIDATSLRGYVCGKVFKSSLFENICFPEGYWFEDTNLSFLVNPIAERIFSISKITYCHFVNMKGSSISVIGRNKCVDSYWITELLNENRNFLAYVCDDYYKQILKRQFLMNYKRTYNLPIRIRENIFLLESKIYQENGFDAEDDLSVSLLSRNFREFELYCYWN